MDAGANDLTGGARACDYNLPMLQRECGGGISASCQIGSQMLLICNQIKQQLFANQVPQTAPPSDAGPEPAPDDAMSQAVRQEEDTFNMVAGIVTRMNKMNQDAANEADAQLAALQNKKNSGDWPSGGVERERADLELARARCSSVIFHTSGGMPLVTAPECLAVDNLEARLCEEGNQRTCDEIEQRSRREAIIGQMAETQARASALESHITSGIQQTHQRQMDRDDFFHAKDELRDAKQRLESDVNSGRLSAADQDIEDARKASRAEEDAAKRLGLTSGQ